MEITRYFKRGFHIFPVDKAGKKPLLKNNLGAATTDIEKFEGWRVRFPHGFNWGLSLAKSGLVAVDVDASGLDAWFDLVMEHGEPQTLKQWSGSGKGMHYIFKAAGKYKGKIATGIDVKHNGYVLVAPSVHRSGGLYRWDDFGAEVADMPGWLVALTEKKLAEPKKSTGDFNADEYRDAALQLAQMEFGYDEWLKLGMALHAASNGSDAGLDLFLEITSGVNFKEGDMEAARAKWASFKPGGGIGPGTFFKLASDLGYIPDTTPAADDFREEGSLKPQFKKTKKGQLVTGDAEGLANYINSQGYAILSGSDDGQIVRHWTAPSGVIHFRTLNTEHFKNALRTMYLFEKKNRPMIDAGTAWIASSFRKSYSKVVFKPQAGPDELNLWCGIPCVRRTGPVDMIMDLVAVICGGKNAKSEYFLDWLAHLMQRPEEKPTIVPVFIGEQGAGKGLFFDGVMARILKDFYSRLDKPGVIKERFNAEQARKFLTVLDEASWRGDHELNGILKSLTGSPTMTVEEKFGGRYTIENYSRYAVLSNDSEAVRVESSNRRFLIFNTSSAWKGTDKFKKVAAGLDAGSHEYFYDYLMARDVSGFDAYTFPERLDTTGATSKVASMGPAGKFWYECLYFSPCEIWGPAGLDMKQAFQSAQFLLGRNFYRYGMTDFVEETRALCPALQVFGESRPVYPIDAYDFFEAFLTHNRLGEMPKDFDPLRYLAG